MTLSPTPYFCEQKYARITRWYLDWSKQYGFKIVRGLRGGIKVHGLSYTRCQGEGKLRLENRNTSAPNKSPRWALPRHTVRPSSLLPLSRGAKTIMSKQVMNTTHRLTSRLEPPSDQTNAGGESLASGRSLLKPKDSETGLIINQEVPGLLLFAEHLPATMIGSSCRHQQWHFESWLEG